ncbi:MAG: rRNA maturation RNase YbeY [Planctomycetes bacterium]|nr:rRNA maturation RNase YbeY [Planctomycetota bacterium]
MRRVRAGGVTIVDRFRPRSDARFLRRVVAAVREYTGFRSLGVALLLTDDRGIAALHREHLGDASPTDVMSFPSDDHADVVVNVQRARAVARRNRTTIRSELALYVVHGLLHVCGHDDHAASARVRMRRAERDVLAQLGLCAAPFHGG